MDVRSDDQRKKDFVKDLRELIYEHMLSLSPALMEILLVREADRMASEDEDRLADIAQQAKDASRKVTGE